MKKMAFALALLTTPAMADEFEIYDAQPGVTATAMASLIHVPRPGEDGLGLKLSGGVTVDDGDFAYGFRVTPSFTLEPHQEYRGATVTIGARWRLN